MRIVKEFSEFKNTEWNTKMTSKENTITRLEQSEIITKAILKFGDLNAVSKWCGVPVWILKNVLKGNEIRPSQYDKMVWMRDRLK
jgi:hypothetical protein